MSDLNDGYGQPTAEEDLRAWEGWLRAATDRLLPRTDPGWEDLLQEARIEFWRCHEALAHETPDNRRRYSLHRAKRHIGKVVNPARGEKPTGMEYRTERQVDEAWSLDALEKPDTILALANALDLIERAYHRNEIVKALRTLPEEQQEYVIRRFWLGLSDRQMAASMGLSPSGVSWKWRAEVRPALEQRLAHLAGAV
jgi:RNA polymerase sigma factor (sigma-70 family)